MMKTFNNVLFTALVALAAVSCGSEANQCKPELVFPAKLSCGDGSPSGTIGGRCKDSHVNNGCTDDTEDATCLAGVCHECGGLGELCCIVGLDRRCDPGGYCQPDDDGFKVCDGSCGEVGEPCCPGTGGCAGTCLDGQCKEHQFAFGCTGSNTYFVNVKLPQPACIVPEPSVVKADSEEEARECVEAALMGNGSVQGVYPTPQAAVAELKWFHYCYEGNPDAIDPISIPAYDEEDAWACNVNQHSQCSTHADPRETCDYRECE